MEKDPLWLRLQREVFYHQNREKLALRPVHHLCELVYFLNYYFADNRVRSFSYRRYPANGEEQVHD